MAPPTPAKMNRAGVVVPGTLNAVVSLKTCPVGGPPGIETTTEETWATGEPFTAPLNSNALDAPWFDTQIGVFGPRDKPQALTKLGTVKVAWPGWSETRLCCW